MSGAATIATTHVYTLTCTYMYICNRSTYYLNSNSVILVQKDLYFICYFESPDPKTKTKTHCSLSKANHTKRVQSPKFR